MFSDPAPGKELSSVITAAVSVNSLSWLKSTLLTFRRGVFKVGMIEAMCFLGERDRKEIDSTESKGLHCCKENEMKNDLPHSSRELENALFEVIE